MVSFKYPTSSQSFWSLRNTLLVVPFDEPSSLSNKVKQDFFQAVFILLNGCTTWMPTKHIGKKKLDMNYPRDAIYCLEQILEATPYKTTVVRPLASYLTNHSSKSEQGIQVTFSCRLLCMHVQVLANKDLHELCVDIRSSQICQKQCMIGIDGKGVSGGTLCGQCNLLMMM